MAQNKTTVSPEDVPSRSRTPRSCIDTSDLDEGIAGYIRNTDRTSTQAQGQSLLTALKNFVVPLGRGTTSDKQEQDIIGRQFLAALQSLIKTILHDSQENHPNRIEVTLKDNELLLPVESENSMNTPSSETSSAESIRSPALSARTLPSYELSNNSLSPHAPLQMILPYDDDLINDGLDFEVAKDNSEKLRHPNGFAKLLSAVQRHVYNTMPIRLLHFEPSTETTLQISLIERGEIYERIATSLQLQEKKFLFDYELSRFTSREQVLIDHYVRQHTSYGILSHTWIRTKPGEVTYADWKKGPMVLLDEKLEGYEKLVNFCKIAMRHHGLNFGWMDTVCINKESSAELDESIRSMYQWYRNSAICITYLAKTASLSDMANDPWFTRGWTLQELLAPAHIKFYNTHWKAFNKEGHTDKSHPEILNQIELATNITKDELDRVIEMASVPISRKMQWAARREVTREEDTAYSLMGIFNISISTAYGEGSEQAFTRLVKEILNTFSHIVDVFNWGGTSHSNASSLLPRDPSYYLQRSSDIRLDAITPIKLITLTHLGLRVPILLIPGLSPPNAALDYPPIGDYYGTIDLFDHEPDYPGKGYNQYPYSYNLLDKRIFDQHTLAFVVQFQLMFGILNFGGDETTILLPQNCLAIGFTAVWKTPVGKHNIFGTRKPIIFKLNRRNSGPPSTITTEVIYYSVPKIELERHGIQLISMYI